MKIENLILPVGLLIGIYLIYNKFTDAYKSKLLSLPYFYNNYYIQKMKNATRAEKEKYSKKFKDMYNVDWIEFENTFKTDLIEIAERKANSASGLNALDLIGLFDKKCDFIGLFGWLKLNCKSKMQFSYICSSVSAHATDKNLNGTEALQKFMIAEGSKTFHQKLYYFLTKLPIL